MYSVISESFIQSYSTTQGSQRLSTPPYKPKEEHSLPLARSSKEGKSTQTITK